MKDFFSTAHKCAIVPCKVSAVHIIDAAAFVRRKTKDSVLSIGRGSAVSLAQTKEGLIILCKSNKYLISQFQV